MYYISWTDGNVNILCFNVTGFSEKKKNSIVFLVLTTYLSSDVKHMIKTNIQHSLRSFTSLGIIPH